MFTTLSLLRALAFPRAGLGQKNMAFVDDREDINSIAMTAVSAGKLHAAPLRMERAG